MKGAAAFLCFLQHIPRRKTTKTIDLVRKRLVNYQNR